MTPNGRYSDLEDDSLLRSCVQRERGAMTELVRRFSGLVRHIVARYVEKTEDREDVYQEVFLAVCHPRTLESLREGNRLRYFIAAVTRHKCRDRIRAVRPWMGIREAGDAVAVADDAGVKERLEERCDLEWAFERLPSTRPVRLGLEMIRLRYWEDRSYREISHQLKIPIGSIGPTLARLFQAIRNALGEEDAEPRGDVSDPGLR